MTPKQSVAAVSMAMVALTGTAQADSAKLVNADNSHTYQRFDTKLSWTDAKIACTKLGAHLATITSQTENNWIHDNLTNGIRSWLGSTDAVQENVWTWITGEPWSYANWITGQPSGGEHYLEIQGMGGWNDTSSQSDPSAYSDTYLCEWENSQYLNVAAIPDVNGDGVMDQAVLTQSAGKYYLRTINGANGKQLKSLSLGTATDITLSGLTVIPDINGDGAVDFALLVLSGGNYSLRVVDGNTGNQLRQVTLGAATGLTPIALTVVDDANANTYKDISILIKNADGSNILQIRDGLMLSVLKTFKLPAK